ncbi:MAG: hypothetical protein EA352_12110 [Gemmatimonadales bacterium]|nr:MAG: hypothetical protein EA352_12110 [Gemmatimonadales bacterium]
MRYRELFNRKVDALGRHCCSSCGTRWAVDNTYFCLSCGTAYGFCCIGNLKETVHQAFVGTPEMFAMVKYRCGCGGRVG